mmetsp:Transcript_18203/g.18262  ORF Transcript_18203/g.18262 Transcript_18203/m.18262 type:complete len:191 (-) Transcript_18203:38-610(-)
MNLTIGQRRCASCSVTETPLWRAGPDGPKTLCNACGVRWRKGKLTLNGVSGKLVSTSTGTGGTHYVGGIKKSSNHQKSVKPTAVHNKTKHRAASKNSSVVLSHENEFTKSDDALDWSMIYFYKDDDDDDGSPAFLEIEPVDHDSSSEDDDAAVINIRQSENVYQDSPVLRKLAHERFSVLLDAAKVIDLT